MKVATTLPLLAATPYVLASFVIPRDLQDGLYDVHKGEDVKGGQPGTHHLVKRVEDDYDQFYHDPRDDADYQHRRSRRHSRSRSIIVDGTHQHVARTNEYDDVCGVGDCEAKPNAPDLTESVPLKHTKMWCRDKTHASLSQGAVRAAVRRLFYTPLFWVPSNSARFALHNGTVAYICSMGGWLPGSLLEFMEAMRLLDDKCPDNDDDGDGDDDNSKAATFDHQDDEWALNVRPAKLSITAQGKFYGREAPGFSICKWEPPETGGVRNELEKKVKEGCETYVNGIVRDIGYNGDCNKFASGRAMWMRLKRLFPWFTDSDVGEPAFDLEDERKKSNIKMVM